MSTKISLAIIAVVAAVGLVTAGSFAATAFAVKKKPNDQVTGISSSNSDSSTRGLLGTSSLPSDYSMPHKTSKPNSEFVANSDQGAKTSTNTVGSGKKILANTDEGSNSGKTAGSNKQLAKLQTCISKAAKGPDGLSRSIVDTCYDQTFYGDFNSQASSKGSSSTNERS
ncbi:MAG TPA: hypothetical protein VFJ05_01470, partial [Nitrososphaeraceae archaeon]|nr:hypothetical protein [Nitrososphaeraceae archaeon]